MRHLIVFARLPRLGRGKRRLARDIGDLAAWKFQRDTLAALLRRLGRDRRWTTWLAVTPDRSRPWPADLRRFGQGEGDLGRRMSRCLAHPPPPGPVVLIGGDIPAIRGHHVAEAFRALGGRDAVFGPAEDGGFWLVGLRRRPGLAPPFAGVRWSGPHALADVLANLRRHRVALLRRLADIDDGAALARFKEENRCGR